MKNDPYILVTGGTGFLGRYIINELIRQKHSNIHIIGSKETAPPLPSEVNYHYCNLLDQPELNSFVNVADIIIHAAGYISYQSNAYDKLYANNVTATENIVNACIELGVDQLIHVSSTAAFPIHPIVDVVEEKHRYNDRNFITAYSMTKYMGESHVWRGNAEGLNTLVINPSLLIGEGDWNRGSANFFKKIYDGLRYYPSGGNGVVYAGDVASFIVQNLQNQGREEQYILSAENIRYKDLFGLIAQRFEREVPSIEIKGVLKYIAQLRDFFIHVFRSEERHLTKSALKNISMVKQFDNSRSLQVKDFKYTPIKEAINKTAEAYLKSINSTLSRS